MKECSVFVCTEDQPFKAQWLFYVPPDLRTLRFVKSIYIMEIAFLNKLRAEAEVRKCLLTLLTSGA
jgi:hypothetical protein